MGGMVGWTIRFFIAAILAALLFTRELTEGASLLVKVLLVLFVALSSVSLIAALRRPLK